MALRDDMEAGLPVFIYSDKARGPGTAPRLQWPRAPILAKEAGPPTSIDRCITSYNMNGARSVALVDQLHWQVCVTLFTTTHITRMK